MRIIAGTRRGLHLKNPDGLDTRPTTDRVKESLFNIIQFHLPVPSVLDLFAGSGALGLEALSRGCEHCVFTEKSRKAAALTQENLCRAGFDGRAEVVVLDALSYLEHCDRRFDLIFLDPPYNQGFLMPVLQRIDQYGLLAPGGILTVETEKAGEVVPDSFFSCKKTAVYGKTVITILQG